MSKAVKDCWVIRFADGSYIRLDTAWSLTAKGARRFDSKLAASNYAIEHVRGGCTIVRVKRKPKPPHPLAGYWAVMYPGGRILGVRDCESSANHSANLWPAARLAVVQLDERGMVPR